MKTLIKLTIVAICLAGIFTLSSCSYFGVMQDYETPASFKIEWPSWVVTKIPSPITPKAEIPRSDDRLSRMGIIVFEDQSKQKPPEITSYVNNILPQLMLNSCNNILLLGGGSGAVFSAESLPRLITGDIDNYALAESGRAMGLNNIILFRLMQVSAISEYKGYMWYRDRQYYVTFDFRVEVYDTASGSKLVDGSGFRKVEIDENTYAMIEQNGGVVPMKLLMPTFEKFAQDEIIPAVCQGINTVPWQAYIEGMDANKPFIRIPGAGQVGFVVGDLLDVHSEGYMIQGIAGERFWYQGPITGTARVIAVDADSIAIEIIDGPRRFYQAVVSKSFR